MVEMTKISQHGKNSSGSATADGGRMNVTNVNWGMYTVVWGQGSKRQSRTIHGSEAMVQAFKDSLKD